MFCFWFFSKDVTFFYFRNVFSIFTSSAERQFFFQKSQVGFLDIYMPYQWWYLAFRSGVPFLYFRIVLPVLLHHQNLTCITEYVLGNSKISLCFYVITMFMDYYVALLYFLMLNLNNNFKSEVSQSPAPLLKFKNLNCFFLFTPFKLNTWLWNNYGVQVVDNLVFKHAPYIVIRKIMFTVKIYSWEDSILGIFDYWKKKL